MNQRIELLPMSVQPRPLLVMPPRWPYWETRMTFVAHSGCLNSSHDATGRIAVDHDVPALMKQFNRRDANKDAKLTLDELKKTK